MNHPSSKTHFGLKRLGTLAAIAITIILAFASNSPASPITFRFSGVITSPAPTGSVPPELSVATVGGTFRGCYTFDDGLTNLNSPDSGGGLYGPLIGFAITVDGTRFRLETSNEGMITIDSYEYLLTSSSGTHGCYISLFPSDEEQFPSVALPLVPFDISNFPNRQVFINSADLGWDEGLQGELTALFTNSPPVLAVPADASFGADSAAGKILTLAVGLFDVDNDPLQVVWNIDNAVSQTNSLPAGATKDSFTAAFGFGSHDVIVTATDDFGASVTNAFHVTVRDTTPPTITGPLSVTVSTDPGLCSASHVNLGRPVTSDNVGISSLSNDAPPVFPKGTTIVTWTVTDAAGNKAVSKQTVKVIDTEVPVIVSTAATPNVLNSPNHKLNQIQVSVGASDNCGVIRSWITSVTSNEPDNGLGDGDTENDIQITGDLTVLLRAERSGKGAGRIYTITVVSQDAAGNLSHPKTVMVTVPKGGK